jgi:hypothetical protein
MVVVVVGGSVVVVVGIIVVGTQAPSEHIYPLGQVIPPLVQEFGIPGSGQNSLTVEVPIQ